MRETVGKNMGVKAAGGVRTADEVREMMIAAGATRIGASAGVQHRQRQREGESVVKGIEVRSYVFLDSLQPQYAAFLGTIAQGFLPLAGDASLFVEISPGIEINRLTDVALKAHVCEAGDADHRALLRPARGALARPGRDRAAGEAILESVDHKETDRIKPKILSSQIIRRLDDHHAQLINRMSGTAR